MRYEMNIFDHIGLEILSWSVVITAVIALVCASTWMLRLTF